MNRLVIIGNGFDLAHGLKTSYMDFINWYWEQRLDSLLTEHTPISQDCLCKLEIKNTNDCATWSNFFFTHSLRDVMTREWKCPPNLLFSFKVKKKVKEKKEKMKGQQGVLFDAEEMNSIEQGNLWNYYFEFLI